MSVWPLGRRLANSDRTLPSWVRLRSRRQALANFLVERDQADRILLMDHQVAQGRGQADAVVELGQLLAIRVAHRAAQVHHQVAGDVGLGLELLDVVLVGLGVDQPVDVLRIVAGRVLAMLAELDRKAVKRAGVQALQEALDDELGAQIEPGNLPDHLGLQILLNGGHACNDSHSGSARNRAAGCPLDLSG